MGTIPGEESNSLRRTWCARVINTLEILKFSPHEEAIFLYRRCREPTPFYWSHHFQIFHLCFTSLKCKLFYKPFSSVRTAVNNKYRWVVFFSFHSNVRALASMCEKKLLFLVSQFLGDNYHKLLFSCAQRWHIYLLSHYTYRASPVLNDRLKVYVSISAEVAILSAARELYGCFTNKWLSKERCS